MRALVMTEVVSAGVVEAEAVQVLGAAEAEEGVARVQNWAWAPALTVC